MPEGATVAPFFETPATSQLSATSQPTMNPFLRQQLATSSVFCRQPLMSPPFVTQHQQPLMMSPFVTQYEQPMMSSPFLSQHQQPMMSSAFVSQQQPYGNNQFAPGPISSTPLGTSVTAATSLNAHLPDPVHISRHGLVTVNVRNPNTFGFQTPPHRLVQI